MFLGFAPLKSSYFFVNNGGMSSLVLRHVCCDSSSLMQTLKATLIYSVLQTIAWSVVCETYLTWTIDRRKTLEHPVCLIVLGHNYFVLEE